MPLDNPGSIFGGGATTGTSLGGLFGGTSSNTIGATTTNTGPAAPATDAGSNPPKPDQSTAAAQKPAGSSCKFFTVSDSSL